MVWIYKGDMKYFHLLPLALFFLLTIDAISQTFRVFWFEQLVDIAVQ